jgi:hypothetical protein
MVENMTAMNPIAKMPGFEAIKAQQEAFVKAMTGGMARNWPSGPDREEEGEAGATQELEDIKKQLSDLQAKLAKLK